MNLLFVLVTSIPGLPRTAYPRIEDYVSYVFRSNKELRKAVKLFFDNKEKCERIYGKMKYWNTRKVTDMSYLFKDRREFNEDISKWSSLECD